MSNRNKSALVEITEDYDEIFFSVVLKIIVLMVNIER
jgi:hypothetical protein